MGKAQLDDREIVEALHIGAKTQTITLTASNATTTVENGTTMVRLSCDVECFYWLGAAGIDATTATTKTHLPAGIVEYRGMPRGGTIAAVGTSGTLYIEEL